MKRVVVTGATGFVGANLARRLLADGHEVHLLVRPEHAPWRIREIRDRVHLHQVALGDQEGLRALVGRIRPDWVFHLEKGVLKESFAGGAGKAHGAHVPTSAGAS